MNRDARTGAMGRAARLGTALLLAAGPGACSSGSDEGSRPQAAKARPAHLVELAEVRRERLAYVTERAGSLRALRTVKIFNQEEGRVLSVGAREGDRVKRGTILIKLDDSLLRAQLTKAVASLRQAELGVKRLEQLKTKQLIAEEAVTRAHTELEIARAEKRLLQTRLGYMSIRAPFSGEVAERRIEPGDVAPKHTHLMTVVDSSRLITDVQVSELALPYLKVGDPAQVRIDALGDRVFTGKVVRIHPTVDPVTRLGKIEVALEPVPPGARAGQFSRVTLSTDSQPRLVIPFAALRRDNNGEYVFVYGEDGRVRRAKVRSGLRLSDKIEIRDGLSAGQRVVARGFLGLSDGKPVKPVPAEGTVAGGDGA